MFACIGILLCLSIIAQHRFSDTVNIERIKHISHILSRDESSVKTWYYGWLAGYSAATVAQITGSCFSKDIRSKQDLTLGAVTSGLGIIGMFLSPVKPLQGKTSDRFSLCFPGKDTVNLQYAEYLLEKTALAERKARSWKTHAICGAVNLGSGLITWICFKRSVWDGLEIFMINTAITEFQIWSSPYRAYKDYNNYCNNKFGKIFHPNVSKLDFTVGVAPGAISLRLSF